MTRSTENVEGIKETRDQVPLVDVLQMAGVNHRTAALALRERVSIPKESAARVMSELRSKLAIKEIVILSTCNRTEFYWTSEKGVDPLQFFRAIPDVDHSTVEKLAGSIYCYSGKDVARHLFEVASGLDSMVIGETQISNQVKNAYEQSRAKSFTGLSLNFLFQKTFETTKKIHSQTGLASHKASIPSVALEFANAIFEDLAGAFVLVIGTGEMAKVTLDALKKRGAVKVGFVTKTEERAACWEGMHQEAEITTLQNIDNVLWQADIIISCTATDEPVITVNQVRQALALRKEPGKPLLILDLGVPRNIPAEVRRLEQVYLRDLDDLQQVVDRNRTELDAEIEKAKAIVEESVSDYLKFCSAATAASTIRELRSSVKDIADKELERALSRLAHLSEEDKKQVEELAHRLLGKFLHNPSERLRVLSGQGDPQTAIELARLLFGLDPLPGLDCSEKPKPGS